MSLPRPENSTVDRYHKRAEPEKESAKRLANSLKPWQYSVPPGPILEIGAGTGIFTEYLRSIFPKREMVISDMSEEMLAFCNDRLKDTEGLTFSNYDAKQDEIKEQYYSLICGNHVAHQLENPATALEKLAKGLTLDGLMLMNFPGEDSFREWRSACLNLGIPYTGKVLPGTESLVIHLSMGPVQVDFYEDQSTWYFDNIQEFLSHFSNGGYDIQKNDRLLTENEIELLNTNWEKKKGDRIGFTYHNVFLALKRVGE